MYNSTEEFPQAIIIMHLIFLVAGFIETSDAELERGLHYLRDASFRTATSNFDEARQRMNTQKKKPGDDG